MRAKDSADSGWDQARTTCWWCGGQLIWDSDHDMVAGFFPMSTNLTCTQCQAHVIYYRPKDEED